MNAADWNCALHFWERARRGLTATNFIVVGVLGIALLSYLSGRSHGVALERSRTADSVRHVFAESSKVIGRRLDARAPVLAKAEAAAAAANARHATTQGEFSTHVRVVDSNTVSIDGGPPVHEIPVSLVLPPIQTCQQAVAADTTDLGQMRAQLVDMTKDRDTWKHRAEIDETQHRSRFGFKTGAVVGGALAAVVVRLAKHM